MLEPLLSSFYYRPVDVSEEDLRLMRWLDEQYTATPFYGSRRMQVWPSRSGRGTRWTERPGAGEG